MTGKIVPSPGHLSTWKDGHLCPRALADQPGCLACGEDFLSRHLHPVHCLDSENGVLLGNWGRRIWSCFSEPSFPSGLSQRVGWIEDLAGPLSPSFPHSVSARLRPQLGGRMCPLPEERTGPSTVCRVVSHAGSAAVSCQRRPCVPLHLYSHFLIYSLGTRLCFQYSRVLRLVQPRLHVGFLPGPVWT